MLDDIASGCPHAVNTSLLKYWCQTEMVPLNHSQPPINTHPVDGTTKEIGITECKYIHFSVSMLEKLDIPSYKGLAG